MSEIIDKIKKLLRMKRGGTPEEVATAVSLAQQIAQKHNIDLGSINPDDEQSASTITHEADVLKSRLPLEAKLAAAILVNFFNVGMVTQHKTTGLTRQWRLQKAWVVNFVGSKIDIEVGRYVFVFLQRHFRHSWAHRQNRKLRNRAAFMHGMFLGLAAKLEKEKEVNQPTGTGLIWLERAVERRNSYIAKLWPNAKDKPLNEDDSDAAAARYAGVVAGQKTEIRKAVPESEGPRQISSGGVSL